MEINSAKYRFSRNGCSSCSMPGVWRAAGYNDKAVVIFHSPKACAHVTRELNLGSYYYELAKANKKLTKYGALLTSNIKDTHSIFGAEDRLLKCIEYAVNNYDAEYIIIANSCVAGIIGDDTQRVAELAEKKFEVPILSVPCYGFLDGKQYYEGFYYAAVALIERFMKPKVKRKNKVTLIGDISEQTFQEIKRYLSYFAVEAKWCFPSKASLKDIKEIPASEFLLTIGGKANHMEHSERIAAAIGGKFNIPVFKEPFPLGFKKTSKWLAALGDLLNKPSLAKFAIEQEKRNLLENLKPFFKNLHNRTTTIIIGRPLEYFNPEWLLEVLACCEIKIKAIIILRTVSLSENNELAEELTRLSNSKIYQEDEYKDFSSIDFVLTTHELKQFNCKQFIVPIFPPYGVSGMIDLLKQLNYLQQRDINSGRSIYGRI